MNKRKLLRDQLEQNVKLLIQTQKHPNPATGWINAIRLALGMSLQQLAEKMSMTKQSVQELEKREAEGAVTLKSLREAAQALDMDLVYGIVPKEGSLDKYVERRARFLAEKIVTRTSNSMLLEDQQNSSARIKKAIDERTLVLKQESPKSLWD